MKIFLIIGGILMLPFVGFGLNTLYSVVSAPSRVITKTLETNNIINNYEWFFDTEAAYNTRIAQIETHTSFMNKESDVDEKRRLRIELAGMQQVCRKLATDYNANSSKMNTNIFKDWSLPDQLNQTKCQ